VLGAEHPSTLRSANNLALSLSDQGKHADAERIQGEVHEVQKRVLGAEHPDTLASASNLAKFLSNQGKSSDAEWIQREVHEVQTRVLGAEHPCRASEHAVECEQPGFVPRRPRQVRRR
jgi:hypothetical protein